MQAFSYCRRAELRCLAAADFELIGRFLRICPFISLDRLLKVYISPPLVSAAYHFSGG